jgi:hypothetical protein
MSGFIEAAASIGILKSVYDVTKGVLASKSDIFEKVIKPLHHQTEDALKDYYFLFYEMLKEIEKVDGSARFLDPDARTRVNQLYYAGKPRRDLIRAICQNLNEITKHSQIRSYCQSLDQVFESIVVINGGRFSPARMMINIMDVCLAEHLPDASFRYQRAMEKQIKIMESRWVAANQMYATLFVKAYRV